MMKIIGITGGVGSGKSELLSYIEKNYNCRILLADLVAHEVRRRGTECFDRLVELLGERILDANGEIDRQAMAACIFADRSVLTKVNAIIHPAVKEYVLCEIGKERSAGRVDHFFIEAALLIEEHYDTICDELWYIYAREAVRRERLRASRGYSDEKIDSIMGQQLSEAEFRKHCKWVIDNSDELELACRQIDYLLGGTDHGDI